MDILEFSKKIINGVGGLHDFEHYEMASPKYDRDVSVAIWVIKCLANPKCEGSEVALSAIMDRRNNLAAEQCVQSDETYCVCTGDALAVTTAAVGVCGNCHKPFRH